MENQEQTVEQQKQKNPKRVEAGKKGAEARRLKKEAKLQEKAKLQEEAAKPVEDNPEPKVHPVLKVTKEQPLLSEQTTSKNYQDYIPICAVTLIIGFGLYFMNKPKVEPEPKIEPEPKVEPKQDPWFMK